MISALQAAQLCVQVYASADDWDHYWTTDDVVIGHKRIGADDVLVFRGSVTAEDWMRDAEAVPFPDTEIGLVHAGFLTGMDDALVQVRPVLRGNIVVTGHSLGGARARIAAAKMVVRGWNITQCTTFGSPKPGMAELALALRSSQVTHTSYRNLDDPVPTLPPGDAWVHTDEWIAVSAAPAPSNLGDLKDHGIALYVQAMSQ